MFGSLQTCKRQLHERIVVEKQMLSYPCSLAALASSGWQIVRRSGNGGLFVIMDASGGQKIGILNMYFRHLSNILQGLVCCSLVRSKSDRLIVVELIVVIVRLRYRRDDSLGIFAGQWSLISSPAINFNQEAPTGRLGRLCLSTRSL